MGVTGAWAGAGRAGVAASGRGAPPAAVSGSAVSGPETGGTAVSSARAANPTDNISPTTTTPTFRMT